MRTWKCGAIIVVLLLVNFGTAVAQSGRTKTANLQVTAEVVANCDVSKNDIAFGPYDPVAANKSAPLDRIDIISMQCTPGTSVKVELDNGQNGSGAQRSMAGPSNSRLNYEISQGNSHNQRFGSGSDAGTKVAGTTGRLGFWMHSRIFPGQNVTVGSYRDTVLATVSY